MIKSTYSIAIMVSNGKRAMRWYRDKLGFRAVDSKGHWITVAPKGSKTVLHLCQANKEWGTELEPGNTGVSFMVDSLDKTYREMMKKGVKFAKAPVDDVWGRYAIFKDPDANEFHLLE